MFDVLARIWHQLLPSWALNQSPDASHFSRRRYTQRYRAKLSLVKNLWIGFGIAWLCCQDGALLVAGILATTLLSFMILDETR